MPGQGGTRVRRGWYRHVSSEVGSITTALDRGGPLWPMASLPYPTSKTALNMITAMYAKELWDTPIKVNAAHPGYCATDLNGHSGFRTADQGAEAIVHLATLDADGPTGSFYGYFTAMCGPPTRHPTTRGTRYFRLTSARSLVSH